MAYWELKIVKMYRIVFLLLSSWLLFSCNENKVNLIKLPYYNQPDFTPLFINSRVEVEQKIPHTIQDFSFLNQDSVLISQKLVENKIHVANFIFTSCGSICP
ncbi:MAG: hypothetical protein RLY16_2535, partial [Bacteroidota bacterium]